MCASVFLNADFLKTIYSNPYVNGPPAQSKLTENIQKELTQQLSLSKKLTARYESLINRLDNDVLKLQKIFRKRDSNGSNFEDDAVLKDLDLLIDERDPKKRRNSVITELIQTTNKPVQTHAQAISTDQTRYSTKSIQSPTTRSLASFGNRNGLIIPNTEPGAIVDSWIDFCVFLEASEFIWHPMLPEIPFKTNITSQLHDKEGIVDNLYRRIYAYLYVPEDGSYDFKLGSRDGAELLIHDTRKSMAELDYIQLSYDQSREVVHLNLSKEVIGKQDPEQKLPIEKLYEIESKDIQMFKNRVYFIEILQGGKTFVKYSLRMKKSRLADEFYTVVGGPNVFHTKTMSSENTPSLIKQKYNPQKLPMKESEKPRLEFYKHSVLHSNKLIEKSNLSCNQPVQKQYIATPDLYWAYYRILEPIQTYPPEYFDQEESGHRTTLTKEEGEQVSNMAFKKLSSLHGE